MDEVQFLNKTSDRVAIEVALKSQTDDVFLVNPLVKLERGRYGGWLLRHTVYPQETPDFTYGVWCYKVEVKKADDQVLEKTKDIQEKVAKVASSLGVNKNPLVSLVAKKYRAVKIVMKKTTDRYSVYDIEPTDREATATLAYVHYHVWWSRRGNCHGELCGVLEKFSRLLKAEFKDGVAVDDVGVYVPYDVSVLGELIEKLREESKEEEEVAAETVKGGETEAEAKEGGEARSGDGWDSYFIVVKLPPGSERVITELEKMVRQKLKELNIAAAVWSVKADV